MARSRNKSEYLLVRVTPEMKKRFTTKAARMGDTPVILREIIQAFIDDRYTIEIPPTVKETLRYVPRIED